MTDEKPRWLPEAEEDVEPKPQQSGIIESDEYPMRVLAGAGTGKTFTMVRKIEHLIEKENVSPDRVLALTFTNNAADSMREKLNAKLGAGGYDIDAYTYHSICNELLTEYAYETDIDPDFDIVSEAEKYGIVLEVLDDIEYRTVKPNVYGPDSYGTGAAANLLGYIGKMKRTGVSASEIEEYLGDAETVYSLEELPERIEDAANDHLRGRSVGSVAEGIPEMKEFLVEERNSLGDTGFEKSVDSFLSRLVELCDATEKTFERHQENPEFELPEDIHKLPAYLLGGYSGAPKGIPDISLELPDLLGDFIEDCQKAYDLNKGYAAYERELSERNLLDFDGLVAETVKLLETETGDGISERWDYVFCDEFQDTDRLQFDLVTSLVPDERLFVVGDDDQAIYEWRGARVANITEELDECFGDRLVDEPLQQNFRSRQPILDLANEAIRLIDRKEAHKTLSRVNESDYTGDAVAVVREASEEDGGGEQDEEVRAEQVVNVVRNALGGDAEEIDESYEPGDIAILVRKRAHAEPITEKFDETGVPYQVAGGVSSESVGVETVVAYLNALARPREDEASWCRVLTMRYRLCDDDLRRITRHDEGVLTGLLETPVEEFEEPGRIEDAREDVEYLLDLRDKVSLGRLYRKMKETTKIEWYLSEQERRDLTQLDEIVGEYGDGAVQPPLTEDFVETLRRRSSLFESSGSSPTSQPELSNDAVNVMTVHKSKGLDFPVVVVPRLTADEWSPSVRDYDSFENAVTESPEAAFSEDFISRDARESRRLLHVAITRAEDHLILQGQESDSGGEEEDEVLKLAEEILPEPWKPTKHRLPIWSDIRSCLPDSAADWTNSLASEVVGGVGGEVIDGDDTVPTQQARDRVVELVEESLDNQLEAVTPPSKTFAVEALSSPEAPMPRVSHSYTSLESYEDCPRQHYLDYVVNAFSDYQESGGDGSGGVSRREIGVLFHDTAEVAAEQGASGREDWYGICERLADKHRVGDALDAAKDCIDRYFELEISDWEVVDAERNFELEEGGYELTGLIDAVYRKPSGKLVVVDYKATERRRELGEDRQLPIYLLACRDIYDEDVSEAGYAYVGPIGPETEIKKFEDEELDSVLSDVTQSMEKISEASFEDYVSGDHCRWCQHKRLPCAPDELS